LLSQRLTKQHLTLYTLIIITMLMGGMVVILCILTILISKDLRNPKLDHL